jgi:hypothetical protein
MQRTQKKSTQGSDYPLPRLTYSLRKTPGGDVGQAVVDWWFGIDRSETRDPVLQALGSNTEPLDVAKLQSRTIHAATRLLAPFQQCRTNLPDDTRASIDETRIQLNQICPGIETSHGVSCVHDSADGNNGQS